MGLQAFVSRRLVTPEGILPGALLVEGETIQRIVGPSEIPANCKVEDFGTTALLPGLVDSHVHINQPGERASTDSRRP